MVETPDNPYIGPDDVDPALVAELHLLQTAAAHSFFNTEANVPDTPAPAPASDVPPSLKALYARLAEAERERDEADAESYRKGYAAGQASERERCARIAETDYPASTIEERTYGRFLATHIRAPNGV